MRSLLRAATVVAVVAAGSIRLGAQQTADRQQRQIDSLMVALRNLQSRLDSMSRAASPTPQTAAPRTGTYVNLGFSGLVDGGWSTESNVASLQLGDHDPRVRGFTIPNAELTLDGAVDPYFKGFVNLVYKLEDGETAVELEEMFALSSSLPGNLQLKAGQFFTEFGRQNTQHPHAWAFVDQPLVLNRMFGAEGLRSQGVRLSWLAPTSVFTEVMVSVLNSSGGTAFSFRSEESSEIHGGEAIERSVRNAGDMLYVPRISTSFDLTGTQTIVLGGSAALGPNNSGPDAKTRVFGGDLYWKWKSPTAHMGFPFVSFQTEAMVRKYDAAERASLESPDVTLTAETFKDKGAYGQVLWGIKPMVVAGVRGEFVKGDPAAFTSEIRGERVRFSPNLTWYPTEFSKIRLQYNYDDRKGIGIDHSLWVQFEFLLGAHAAHKF
jgi:hypothetical protein